MYKILLVEDMDLIRRNILEMIDWESYGCQVIAQARNGEQGLLAYEQAPADIVITDIKMPVMDGLTMIRQIKQLNPQAQFILLTAYEEFDYAKQAISMGIHSYLLKHELDPSVLLAELKKLCQAIETKENYYFLNKSDLLRRHLNEGIPLEDSCLPLYPWSGWTALILLENRDLCAPDSAPAFRRLVHNLRKSLPKEQYTGYSLSQSLCMFLIKTASSSRTIAADPAFNCFGSVLEETVHTCPVRYALSVSPAFFDLHSLPKAYDFAKSQLMEQVFFHHSCILTPSAVHHGKEPALNWLKQQTEAIGDYLIQHKFFHAQKAIRSLLEEKLPLYQSVFLYQTAVSQMVTSILAVPCPQYPVDVIQQLTETRQTAIRSDVFTVAELLCQAVLRLQQLLVPQYSKKVEEILSYIKNHYQEEISLTHIAEHVGLTPLYVSQLFKKEVGMNLMSYITRYRIQVAMELLKTGNYKVYEVSQLVGYQTVQYFSSCFKKETGKKPSEYC
ncbi:MAG: response regulator [Hungatella sp.]|nr:response regulator [Hungatella sp.]